MYSTVRSNSFSASMRVLPISHMRSRTTSARVPTIWSVKTSRQRSARRSIGSATRRDRSHRPPLRHRGRRWPPSRSGSGRSRSCGEPARWPFPHRSARGHPLFFPPTCAARRRSSTNAALLTPIAGTLRKRPRSLENPRDLFLDPHGISPPGEKDGLEAGRQGEKRHLPSSPIVTASAEQYDQHDNDNDECCIIHGNFLLFGLSIYLLI